MTRVKVGRDYSEVLFPHHYETTETSTAIFRQVFVIMDHLPEGDEPISGERKGDTPKTSDTR